MMVQIKLSVAFVLAAAAIAPAVAAPTKTEKSTTTTTSVFYTSVQSTRINHIDCPLVTLSTPSLRQVTVQTTRR